jgi:hypothetical protein
VRRGGSTSEQTYHTLAKTFHDCVLRVLSSGILSLVKCVRVVVMSTLGWEGMTVDVDQSERPRHRTGGRGGAWMMGKEEEDSDRLKEHTLRL